MNPYPYTIDDSSGFSELNIQIPAEQSLVAFTGTMVMMDSKISLTTKVKGGMARFLKGQAFILNEFKAGTQAGSITLSPGNIGEIMHYSLGQQTLYLQSAAYLASMASVNLVPVEEAALQEFYSGKGLFLLQCRGEGDIWFHVLGSLFTIDVRDEYLVDAEHVVAFTEGLECRITPIKGYRSLFFPGEGLACQFSGAGQVWIQTGKPSAQDWWVKNFQLKKVN